MNDVIFNNNKFVLSAKSDRYCLAKFRHVNHPTAAITGKQKKEKEINFADNLIVHSITLRHYK